MTGIMFRDLVVLPNGFGLFADLRQGHRRRFVRKASAAAATVNREPWKEIGSVHYVSQSLRAKPAFGGDASMKEKSCRAGSAQDARRHDGRARYPLIGWIVHFMIGIVLYGIAIALLDARLPGNSHVGHGLILGVVGWLIMMIVLMPMAGVGLFGMNMGVMAPMMTLVLHLIFGAVLGWVYGRSIQGNESTAPARR